MLTFTRKYVLKQIQRIKVPTYYILPLISTIVNGTLLNFVKRYENALMVIFDQWPKLYFGFDPEPEIRILKVKYLLFSVYVVVKLGYVVSYESIKKSFIRFD